MRYIKKYTLKGGGEGGMDRANNPKRKEMRMRI